MERKSFYTFALALFFTVLLAYAEEPGGGETGCCGNGAVCCQSSTECSDNEYGEKLTIDGDWWICCAQNSGKCGHICENAAAPN